MVTRLVYPVKTGKSWVLSKENRYGNSAPSCPSERSAMGKWCLRHITQNILKAPPRYLPRLRLNVRHEMGNTSGVSVQAVRSTTVKQCVEPQEITGAQAPTLICRNGGSANGCSRLMQRVVARNVDICNPGVA